MKIKMPDGELVENKTPQWKTPFNHDTDFESERTGLYCRDPSLTKQEFKEDADINVILERFMRGGDLPPPVLPEHFADTSGKTTYFEMASKVAIANKVFYELDAKKRAEHLNDPTRWADAVVKATEAKDADALEQLGIDVSNERKAAEETAQTAKAARDKAAQEKAATEALRASKTDTGGK